jgi:tRNA G37 N-methylase TrmD
MRIDIVTVLPELLRSPLRLRLFETCHRQRTGGSSFSQFTDYTTNKKVLTITNTAERNGYDCTAY